MGYRDAVLRCALCEAELTDARRYAGVALCPGCHDGKNPRALLARGIHVQTVEESAVTQEGQRREYRYALGATSSLLPIQAGFDREGFLGRRFKIDLQTGDQLFDDAISIAGKVRESAARDRASNPPPPQAGARPSILTARFLQL